MKQYIPKSALVVEIKRILSAFENSDAPVDRLRASTLIRLLSFIDTLKVKEVDLEKEIDLAMPSKYCWSGDGEAVYSKEQMRNFAKHFFELGMTASKEKEI